MKILIIGAGWYGCHLAKSLREKGVNITIIDRENDVFKGSSSKNQNRLHLGFHYPRSDDTMIECLRGYQKFLDKYSELIVDFDKNFYFISSKNSNIDIHSYIKKMSKHCEPFFHLDNNVPIPIHNVEQPILAVKEKYINPFKASSYFKRLLGQNFKIITDSKAFDSIETITHYLSENYDFIINCTYNSLNPISYIQYECFVTLLYKIDNFETFAYTIMDGPFFSIYPYDIPNKIYTVTSVIHGVAYKGKEYKYTLENEQLNTIKTNMESQIIEYIPSWQNIATYVSYFTSWKTKHDYEKDDRSVRFKQEGKNITFYGGKITGIFEAEDILYSLLKV